MELNETLGKVDQNLEATVKKVEKTATDMLSKDLKIEVNQSTTSNLLILIRFVWPLPPL